MNHTEQIRRLVAEAQSLVARIETAKRDADRHWDAYFSAFTRACHLDMDLAETKRRGRQAVLHFYLRVPLGTYLRFLEQYNAV